MCLPTTLIGGVAAREAALNRAAGLNGGEIARVAAKTPFPRGVTTSCERSTVRRRCVDRFNLGVYRPVGLRPARDETQRSALSEYSSVSGFSRIARTFRPSVMLQLIGRSSCEERE